MMAATGPTERFSTGVLLESGVDLRPVSGGCCGRSAVDFRIGLRSNWHLSCAHLLSKTTNGKLRQQANTALLCSDHAKISQRYHSFNFLPRYIPMKLLGSLTHGMHQHRCSERPAQQGRIQMIWRHLAKGRYSVPGRRTSAFLDQPGGGLRDSLHPAGRVHPAPYKWTRSHSS